MYKFLSIHFKQHINNAQLLKINKSRFTKEMFFANCNKMTTCTSKDKWLKQLLVYRDFFRGVVQKFILPIYIEKGT